jgi:hypothetical protein
MPAALEYMRLPEMQAIDSVSSKGFIMLLPAQVLGGLPEDTPEQPEIPTVQGHELQGGPQMLQLS